MSESTPKQTTIASLFDQLEAFGAGSMHLTAADKDGKVLSCIIVATGENARDLMRFYEQDQERDAGHLSGVLDEDDEWMDDDDD